MKVINEPCNRPLVQTLHTGLSFKMGYSSIAITPFVAFAATVPNELAQYDSRL
jgi:hypothetical protein